MLLSKSSLLVFLLLVAWVFAYGGHDHHHDHSHDHHHEHSHDHDHSHDHGHHHEHHHDDDVVESLNQQGQVEEREEHYHVEDHGERVDDDDDEHHKAHKKLWKKHPHQEKAGEGAGCPFMKDTHFLDSFKACPKFKEGCPYKTEELLHKLKDCPAFKESCPFAVDGENKIDVSKLHDCPVFLRVDLVPSWWMLMDTLI